MRVIRLALVLLIGGVLFIAAVGKLLDNRLFAEKLAQWQLFPNWSLLALGVIVSLSELILAVWLFSGWRLSQAAIAAVVFHLGYTGGTLVTLLRGIRLPDCGCFGVLFPHELNWTMAFEDMGFAALALFLYLIASHEELPRRRDGLAYVRDVRRR